MSGSALSGEPFAHEPADKLAYVYRNTLANPSIRGYKTSLHLPSDQYNIFSTTFYFSYPAIEIPSQIIHSAYSVSNHPALL
jgi:hypothetical protein